MLPKPIIRDGVDVSRCSDLGCQYNCTAKANMLCETFPNCYFKKLQRKTIECNRFKQALDKIEKESRQIVDDECTTYQATGVCYTFLDIIAKAKENTDES